MTAETIHTCSYSCERPGCIRAQRDELAARLAAETSNARGKVEYEYEVWQGAVLQAGGREADCASAQSEAGHYAAMYIPDGPVEVRIYEKRLISAYKVQPKRRRYDPSGSLSEYGIFPECDAQPLEAAPPPSQENAMDKPPPEAVVEAVARAICVACEENPDRQGDARGNEFRWQDYRDTALAAISAFTAAQQPAEQRAEIEALRAEVERLRDDGASAVRWAPGPAYWSEVLVELFGPDARKGIDVLEARWRKEIERAERLAEALEDIRSRSSIDLAMRSDQFELTARLGDIYQIADAALSKENSND